MGSGCQPPSIPYSHDTSPHSPHTSLIALSSDGSDHRYNGRYKLQQAVNYQLISLKTVVLFFCYQGLEANLYGMYVLIQLWHPFCVKRVLNYRMVGFWTIICVILVYFSVVMELEMGRFVREKWAQIIQSMCNDGSERSTRCQGLPWLDQHWCLFKHHHKIHVEIPELLGVKVQVEKLWIR